MAAQLSILSSPENDGTPSNVNVDLGESVTPDGVVKVVIKS